MHKLRAIAIVPVAGLAAILLAAAPAQAISGGANASTGAYSFTAKVSNEAGACTGVLVAPQWIITSTSCFPDNPQGGTPAKATTVTIGRTNLSSTDGHVATVAGLVVRTDRSAILARLDTAITDITPTSLSTAAPAAGDTLRMAAYGRTATTWVPDQLQTSPFAVASTATTTMALTGNNGADACKGDAGAPVFREAAGHTDLAGIVSTSWQHGCLVTTETRQGTTIARTDDLVDWIRQQVLSPMAKATSSHTITVSWNALAAQDNASYRVYASTSTPVPVDAAHLISTTPATTLTQASVPARQTRYYQVVATTADGRTTPPTAAVSTTTSLAVGNDFTGDGKDDIGAGYNFTGARTGMYVWPTTTTGVAAPALKWDSGAGNFNAAQARWVSGDFNGDGRGDFGVFYDYLNNSTNLFLWYANATGGFNDQGAKWNSINFTPSKARFVTGDFDGDGRTDIGAAYDNGNANTSFLTWHATTTGFDNPITQWSTGAGAWSLGRSYWAAGDFTGDGRTDLAAFYDYGNNTSSLFIWNATAPTPGFNGQGVKWTSTTFATPSARLLTGDFDGDGRTDIGAAYDNGNANTSFLTWHATTTGFDNPTTVWSSGAGGWSLGKSQWIKGDFDGDGRTDISASYDYGSGNTSLFFWHANTLGGLDGQGGKWNSNGALAASQAVFL